MFLLHVVEHIASAETCGFCDICLSVCHVPFVHLEPKGRRKLLIYGQLTTYTSELQQRPTQLFMHFIWMCWGSFWPCFDVNRPIFHKDMREKFFFQFSFQWPSPSVRLLNSQLHPFISVREFTLLSVSTLFWLFQKLCRGLENAQIWNCIARNYEDRFW